MATSKADAAGDVVEDAPVAPKKKRGKKAAKKRGRPAGKRGDGHTQRTKVSADQLPRKSLEQSLRVARALRDVHAGGPAKWAEIASAMGIIDL